MADGVKEKSWILDVDIDATALEPFTGENLRP
jgi:hypothetical protein